MDQGEFHDFFDAVWTELSSYGRSLTGDAGVGDELAQEALTRVYTRYPLLREPRGYAFRIVTNLARSRWRTQQRERFTWEHLPSFPASETADVDLLDAVYRLKPAHRDVLLLHYWTDLRVEDVASVLRRPTGTVKRRLVAAREELAEALEMDR